MSALTQLGYFVFIDISGYTSFVAGTELEHAHDILSDLLQTVCKAIVQLLTIHKLEGDAVFAYVPEGKITRGETLVELIESTYLAFRDRQLAIKRATTCSCKACTNIPSLDLKFICHCGEYILQRIANITEMVGSDVNLVHRLSKNHVSEATGWRAYVMFTERCLNKLDLQIANPFECIETYEHLGQVKTFNLDLHRRYQELLAARRVVISESEADLILHVDFPTPPAIAWEWLLDPVKRNLWGNGVKWSTGDRPNGRVGSGASNHCAHGGGVRTEIVLDWRPFEYSTSNSSEQGGKGRMSETFRFEPLPDGSTRVHDLIRLDMPLPRWLRKLMARFILINNYKYDALLMKASKLAGEEVLQPGVA